MTKQLTCLALLLLLSTLYGNCFAEGEYRQLHTNNTGFTVSLQQVDQPLLLLELEQLQQELWSQQISLLTQIAEMSFNVVDAIITIVVPGGLVYAFNKKLNHKKAKTDLNALNIKLAHLQEDMSALNLQIALL
ncbi:MAG: hypothetical protein L3J28_01675 [Candidatus Polarisedimenticolaceae bacterium]|nr:hypothetical protein [Candidatus Polarisedimenticolaceae bacterium]